MTNRFSDEELTKLREEFHACQTEGQGTRELLLNLRRDVKCLHVNMEDYVGKNQPILLQLERMLPRLDELLTRFSQAKGIFWFLTLVSGMVIAQAFGAFSRVVSYVKGLIQ